MRWFFGRPPGLLPLGEMTFRYRGIHDFQIERDGHFPARWWCHNGFRKPVTLNDRRSDRELRAMFGDDTVAAGFRLNILSEDGFGSFTKNGVLRRVCRSIDRAVAEADAEDRRYLEAKAVKAAI